MTQSTQQFTYDEIRKVVWAFADMVRDKGNGTVEDYAKIVLPTCLVKRTLDLQAEFNANKWQGYRELIETGVFPETQIMRDLNNQSYGFFNNDYFMTENPQFGIVFITWQDLMAYEENPNSEERFVGSENALGGMFSYKTTAKNFVELMFEIISHLNPEMKHVFSTFEYEQLIMKKNIVPFYEFYKVCQNELSKFSFNMANISTDMFSDMYMDLMGRFAHDAGKKGGEFFTPTPLVRNAWRFIDIKHYAKLLVENKIGTLKIGDPTAGSNTFLIYGYDMILAECDKMKPGAISKARFEFYGQELKAFQYCLGLMNMIFHNTIDAYNVGIDIKNQNANTINQYFSGIGQKRNGLDIVVANPPYGTKDYGIAYAEQSKLTDPRWKFGVPSKQEGEYAFLMTIYDLLNKNGKAVVVMPLGTLFRDGAKNFREQLINEDVVEGIVELPKNMFLTTSIPVCLWILNKNKAEADKGKVFMVNASNDFEKVGKFNEWQPDSSVDHYLNRTPKEEYSGYVDFKTLSENEFNLSTEKYFNKTDEEETIDIEVINEKIKDKKEKIDYLANKINSTLLSFLKEK